MNEGSYYCSLNFSVILQCFRLILIKTLRYNHFNSYYLISFLFTFFFIALTRYYCQTSSFDHVLLVMLSSWRYIKCFFSIQCFYFATSSKNSFRYTYFFLAIYIKSFSSKYVTRFNFNIKDEISIVFI